MKKLCLISLTLLSCGMAYALPVGNPCEASLLGDGILWCGRGRPGARIPLNYTWSIRTGACYDHLFDKTMRLQVGSKPSIDGFEMSTYSAYLAFNLWDRIDLFGSLGASNFNFEANQTDFSPNTFASTGAFNFAPANFTVQSSADFAWGIGLRATLFNLCGVCAGVEGEYFETRPHIKKVVGLFRASDYPDDILDTKYHEWQVGAGVGYGRLKYFSPYAAFRWSTATLRMGGFGTLPSGMLSTFPSIGTSYPYQLHNLESKSNWGFAFGGTFLRRCNKSLTIEGRVGSETAVYVNGQIRI